MANITVAELLAYFRNAVAEGWGYVWSLNGELYTQALAEHYHKIKRSTSKHRDPATYWLQDCKHWIGKMAADCSGGIIGAHRTKDPKYKDRGADTLFGECVQSGPIKTLPEEPGLCLWRPGHIELYDGGGNSIGFRGTNYGAVRSRVASRDFTHWGRLRDVDYANGEGIKMPRIIEKNLTYDAGIEAYQELLNAFGYPCGKADGKAGDKTIAAHAAFVAAHSTEQALPEGISVTAEMGGKTYRGDAIKVK